MSGLLTLTTRISVGPKGVTIFIDDVPSDLADLMSLADKDFEVITQEYKDKDSANIVLRTKEALKYGERVEEEVVPEEDGGFPSCSNSSGAADGRCKADRF